MVDPLAGNPLVSRVDHADAIRAMVEPLVPHMSPGGARVDLGRRGTLFSAEAAHFEGYARPLWGLAALAAGGHDFDHWDRWREGLASGVDPDHPEFWGIYEGADQRMVEQAAIGWTLAVAPHEMWEPLADRTREQLVEWLSLINRHEPFGNNWQFFRVLVNVGLSAVGADIDRGAQERSLAALHDLHVGDGWYHDGPGGACDLYVPCALHYYGLLYAALVVDDHATAFRERARAYARDWAAWFADDGDVVPYGRSLTYRFVTGAFWAGLAIADEEAVPWGEARGLLGRHLRAWSGRDLWRGDGTLSVGYRYEQASVGEEYISAASPYWAMKSFAAVAAPEDHPFWRTPETPAEPTAEVVAQPVAGMVLARDPGHVVALSGRQGAAFYHHGPDRYARFAYSSRYGFSLAGDHTAPHQVAPDGMLALSEGHGPLRVRTTVTAWELVDDDLLWTEWRPWPEVTIRTVLWAAPPWHLRLHAIDTDRRLDTTEGGFAIGFGGSGATGPEPDRVMEAGRASASTARDLSVARDPHGERAGLVIAPLPDTNLHEPRTLLPVLVGAVEPGRHRLAGFFAAGPVDGPTATAIGAGPPAIPERVLTASAG